MSNIDFDKLKEPFPASEIEWRIGQAGGQSKPWAKLFAYITNRGVQKRLDDVVGPPNWQIRHRDFSAGIVAEIGINISGEWVWKGDGASPTQTEPFKGALSNSMKRAAVQWGIGRYLYYLGNIYAKVSTTKENRSNGWRKQTAKQGKYVEFWWLPPALPRWALPKAKVQLYSPAYDKEHIAKLSQANDGADVNNIIYAEMTEKSLASEKAINWWIKTYLSFVNQGADEKTAVLKTNQVYLEKMQ